MVLSVNVVSLSARPSALPSLRSNEYCPKRPDSVLIVINRDRRVERLQEVFWVPISEIHLRGDVIGPVMLGTDLGAAPGFHCNRPGDHGVSAA